jgi:hypothetical protein
MRVVMKLSSRLKAKHKHGAQMPDLVRFRKESAPYRQHDSFVTTEITDVIEREREERDVNVPLLYILCCVELCCVVSYCIVLYCIVSYCTVSCICVEMFTIRHTE